MNPDVCYLTSAMSWFNAGGLPLKTPNFPAQVTRRAADCGAYWATFVRGGSYPFHEDEYIRWLSSGWNPQWAAMMDFCCEDWRTTGKDHREAVGDRQYWTTQFARSTWANHRDVPWVWVPTIQGWDIADYDTHAWQMRDLVSVMQTFYERRGQLHLFRVGVGTLAHHTDALIVNTIADIVGSMLHAPLHLWGVKRAITSQKCVMNKYISSLDSSNWDGMRNPDKPWKEQGLSQMEYAYTVAQPLYIKRITNDLSVPKQSAMTTLLAAQNLTVYAPNDDDDDGYYEGYPGSADL